MTTGSRNLSMARILVVEDEPTIAMGLQDDLRLEGHVVDVIGDERQAEPLPENSGTI